nr:V-set domain-containing T-cell activation inhibitor 1-like [Misgurnus anguillicaudatus]
MMVCIAVVSVRENSQGLQALILEWLTNTSLTAEAQRWFPQPEVTWLSQSGELLNSSSQFSNNSAGITQVVSVLEFPVKVDETYTCLIQNSLVKAFSEATVTGNEVTGKTYFIFNAASTILSSQPLFIVILHFFLK